MLAAVSETSFQARIAASLGASVLAEVKPKPDNAHQNPLRFRGGVGCGVLLRNLRLQEGPSQGTREACRAPLNPNTLNRMIQGGDGCVRVGRARGAYHGNPTPSTHHGNPTPSTFSPQLLTLNHRR